MKKNTNFNLTIAIPTYNQPYELLKTLESLDKQLYNINEDVEVLILDDSENFETKKIVDKFKIKNLRYFKGKKVHLDHANFWLMKNAFGKFVWWFGDDIFYPNAIERIKTILKLNPDFVWVNSNSKENVPTKEIGKSRWMSGSEVIIEIGDLLTFLSALVWKRNIYSKKIEIGEPYIGTCMAYLYTMLEIFSEDKKFYYCHETLFHSNERDFKNLWYNPFSVFSTNYFDALDFFSSKPSIRSALKKEKIRRGKQILKGVIYYKYNLFEYGLGKTSITDLFKVYLYWPYFWMMMPLILIIFLRSKIYNIFEKKHFNFNNKSSLKENVNLNNADFLKLNFKCINCKEENYTFHPKIIKCLNCNSTYDFKDDVVKLDKLDDPFYEGKYQGHIKYIPKTKSLFSNMVLWSINSGYLWYVKKFAKENSSILELGCGAGVSYFGTFNTIGMDLSYNSMKENKVNYKFFLKSDITNNIPLKSESMDLIVSSFFWEHINLNEKNKCLKEINRVLKPNGRVIFLFDVETKNPLINMFKKINYLKYKELFIDGDKHIGYESIRDNCKRFEKQGFQIETTLGCEKTFFQSWSTFSKLSKFNSKIEIMFNFISIKKISFLFYPYTFFLRLIDETLSKILPEDWSRTVLVVLNKKHD